MKSKCIVWTLEAVASMSIFFSVSVFDAGAYEERNFIRKAYDQALYKSGEPSLVKTGGDWFPYPDYNDRAAWDSLFARDAGRVIAQGEQLLDYEWKIIPATAYLEYERSGNRKIMENPLDANRVALNKLILAELAEGKGRFIDQIADGLWMSCQMTSWVLSAHNPRQSSHRALPDPREYIIDLGSAGYGASVSIAYHFFKDELAGLDPSINYCIEEAVRERILDPFMDLAESVRTANWWIADRWKPGETINNWNPWCNSNVLLCYLLMETDQERLDAALRRSVMSADMFLNFVKGDGACEEGPAYWGHAAGKLFDYLKILYDATGGRVSLFDNPQVQRMGEYISRSYIGDSRVVNFADAVASMTPDIHLAYRYGKATGSVELEDFALYLLYDSVSSSFRYPSVPGGDDTYRSLEALQVLGEMDAEVEALNGRLAADAEAGTLLAGLRESVPAASWYPETEFCYLRDSEGNFFAAKGGFNNESHNHNDVGTFILYSGDKPLFVDAGVGTYTRKTFSPERYTIWTMQSGWHSLPVINGTEQCPGQEYRSSDVSCNLKKREFSLDISGAYPDAASCSSWVRKFRLQDGRLVIRDSYRIGSRTAADTENFLVYGEVYLPGETYVLGGAEKTVPSGKVVLVGDGAAAGIAYPSAMTPSVTVMEMDDPRLTNVWGPVLRRISFTSEPDAPVSGTYEFKIDILQ